MSERRQPRSFVRRAGRLTSGQSRALERLWPRYGIEPAGLLDLERLFGRAAPRHLEIGFGDGEALVERATADPDSDYLGVEVHPPGVGHCLLAAEAAALTNLRVVSIDAVELLRHHLAQRSLAAVELFFPDPWPKKRHHKRRIVQPQLLDLLADRLEPHGALHLATDWADYATWMLTVLEADDRFVNSAGPRRFLPPPPPRPETKFERRGLRRGHRVFDLHYRLAVGSRDAPAPSFPATPEAL